MTVGCWGWLGFLSWDGLEGFELWKEMAVHNHRLPSFYGVYIFKITLYYACIR